MAKISKKDMILKKSLKYFSQYGYENTNLEAIANECEITKPAIYYHFKNKADLYRAVICPLFLDLANKIERNTLDGKAVYRLEIYIQTFGNFLISHPQFNAIFAREIANGAETLPLECSKFLSRTLLTLIDILESGVKDGVFEEENPFMIQMMIVTTLTSYNTTKPLREKIVSVLENKTKLPEANFENVIESLSNKIIKGLKC